MDYKFDETRWYIVYHILTNEMIMFDRLDVGFTLSTIHTVVWITEQEFNDLSEN